MRKNTKKHTAYALIAIQIFIMVVLSVVVTIVVSERTGRSSVEHMKTISDSRAKMIEEYVGNVEQMLSIYSCSPEIIGAVLQPENEKAIKSAQEFTEDFSSKIENLEGIYVSEWDTHVLAHTNPAVVGMITRKDEGPLQQLRNALTEAGEGVYDTGIIISPASGQQIVSMYKGIFDENGNPLGLVGLGVYTSGLVQRLNDFENRGFDSAEYYMVNVADGTYIFNDDSKKITVSAENGYIQELCEKYKTSSQNETGAFEYTSSENGEKYVSVYNYLAGRGWIFVLDDIQSEAYRLSSAMKIYLMVFCTIIFAVMIVIGYEMRKSAKKADHELLIKEQKHKEELDSILISLSENSSMVNVSLSSDSVISCYGFSESEKEILSNCRESGAMEECRKIILSDINDDSMRKRASDILDSAKLQECFAENEKDVKCSYNVSMPDGSVEVRELHISMLRNLVNNNIEAVIQINDISDEYYKNIVGTYLALRQFKFTTIIFINSGRGRSLSNNTDIGKENILYDYDFFRRDIYEKLIDINERDEFFEKISAENIIRYLEKEKIYAVYVHGISETGEKIYLKYEFQYIDSARETVLLCVSDETVVWENDVLTGLCNYKGFISQASYVLENSSENDEFAVLVTNIKWFKVINKIFGAARCDEFLKEYADILRSSALEPVVIGRFPASDHFIMLIRRENFKAEEIIKISHQHIESEDREVDVLITCGIYNITNKKSAVSDMVDHAIMAFKGIKDFYNVPYAAFSDLEEERYLSGKLVVSGFEKALREGEFQPFYQPIFDAVTHRIVSAEALVRWKRNGSFIPPGMFIPALEENGSVSRVDLYISDCVTEFLKKRKQDGKNIVPISVNLSGMDFYASDTIDGVMKNIEIMVDYSIIPRYEITETAWADAMDNKNEIIETMREKGTQILIDDFGSGYSSFSTLRDFNFDILKIDMGFIRKIGQSQKADSIVSSIIDMAHFIGLKVVAEGVETKEHLDFLTEHGCDYIQGYYFSKPLPEDEFEKLLDEQMEDSA